MIYFSSLCADGGKAVVSSAFELSLALLCESVETADVPSFGANEPFEARGSKISRAVITAQMMKKMSDATRQPVPFVPFLSFVLPPERETVRLKEGGTGGSVAAGESVLVSDSTGLPQPEQKTALSGKALPHFEQFIFLSSCLSASIYVICC